MAIGNNFKIFVNGLQLKPIDSQQNPQDETGISIEGFVYVYANKLKIYLDSAIREIITADQVQTLTNKTIDSTNSITMSDDSFVIQDVVDATKELDFDVEGVTGTKTTIASAQTSNRIVSLPDATDTLVGKATLDTLTNKSIDSDNNTITNIVNADIKAAAAIVESKLDLDYATSDLNTNLNNHMSDTTTHGTTGNVVGDSDTQNLSNKTFTDSTTFSDVTESTSKDTGAVIVEGGLGVEKNLNVGGNVVITGDLQIDGTTTSVNSTTLEVTDPNIIVNNNGNQASADTNSAGLTVEMSDATDAVIGYDSSLASKFSIGESGSESEITTVSDVQTLTNKTHDDEITFKEIATPSTPAAGYQSIYPKTDGKFYRLDDGGIETELGSGSGGSGGLVQADYHDPSSTSLPTGTSVTIDGSAGVNGDLVLFSNLSVDNNKIYQLGGVGVSLTWTATLDFTAGVPEDGDTVVIRSGTSFRDTIGIFDGTDWKFNDTVRYFSGEDYWEQSSLKTSPIVNNTTDNIFTVSVGGSENMIIDYSIIRSTSKETGTFTICSDGTSVTSSRHGATLLDTGVTLNSDISAGDIRFRYIADASGSDGTIKYSVKRWSNVAGGPGGIPNYSVSGGSSVAAAGNLTEIQFHGSTGNLDADSNLTWDASNNAISMNGLKITALSGSLTLNDNQAVASTIVTYPKTSKYTIIEYSIERGNSTRVGRLLIPTNGITTILSDDYAETSVSGILLSVIINGSNIELQYTSTSTGNTGTFQYAFRQWS